MALYAFDGTWKKDEDPDDKDSNVFKLYQAYRRRPGADADKDETTDPVDLYQAGVGTRWWWIGKLLGGLLGLGARRRVDRALTSVDENRARGDQIVDVVGFSRGAAIALHFAARLQARFGSDQPVRFMGLFDLVGSFGLPGNRWDLGWDIDAVPPNVRVCYHALALDEGRATFPLTRLVAAPADNDADAPGRLFEVWFRGSHSDVGGGNGNVGLSSISLAWMLQSAVARGLPIPADAIDRHRGQRRSTAPVRRSPLDTGVRGRTVQWDDLVHESVGMRAGARNPPVGAVRVDDRMRVVGRFFRAENRERNT